MKEFKGTKGKWEFDIDEYYSHAYVYVQGKGNVCELNYTDENMRETPHNMQLISKAPEMLEMLKSILASEHLKGTIEESKVKQLIKQATELL